MSETRKRGRPPKVCEFLKALHEGLKQEEQEEEILDIPAYNGEGKIIDDSELTSSCLDAISALDPEEEESKQLMRQQEEELKKYQQQLMTEYAKFKQYNASAEQKDTQPILIDPNHLITKKPQRKGRQACSVRFEGLSSENQQKIMDIIASEDNTNDHLTKLFRLIFFGDYGTIFYSKLKSPKPQNQIDSSSGSVIHPTKKPGRPRKKQPVFTSASVAPPSPIQNNLYQRPAIFSSSPLMSNSSYSPPIVNPSSSSSSSSSSSLSPSTSSIPRKMPPKKPYPWQKPKPTGPQLIDPYHYMGKTAKRQRK